MIQMDDLAGKVFSLLKGNGLQIKIFDEAGSETTDPNLGRRFFVIKPNIMVTIDEDSNKIEFSKGKDVDNSILGLQKNIRKLADQFLMNSNIKVFGKSIQPKDYAYQAKMNKGNSVMENTPMQPVNHHLVGEIMQIIKRFGNPASYTIQSNVGSGMDEIQLILNRLVKSGKIKAEPDSHGDLTYSVVVDEAVMEANKKDSSKHAKEIAKKRLEYENEQAAKRDKTGETYHYGNAKVVKDSAKEIKESFSKMYGSLKTSQQTLENVKILVRHKTPVDENIRGARSRHISAIFLECNGERFRFQHNYLPGARAMAQHMAHGGVMSDKLGSYINESTANLLKLQSFNRYVTTNKLINEDSSGIVETVKENIETLRTELKKLTGSKTYETVKARIETFEREPLAEDDTSQLKDLFTIRRFDEKFEEVLPIVKQLVQEKDTFYKRIEEAATANVIVRSGKIQSPIFEFASEHAKLGFMISELALRIVENQELAGFVSKVGTKLCKEGLVNDFERAIMLQIFENIKVEEKDNKSKKEIKEAFDLAAYFDRFDYNFM